MAKFSSVAVTSDPVTSHARLGVGPRPVPEAGNKLGCRLEWREPDGDRLPLPERPQRLERVERTKSKKRKGEPNR